FATQKHLERQIPGRIIGVSIDKHQNRALRMALQTREQHIRRDKATSNICTAQALLAIMASMYAVYHGATGLKNIAQRTHHYTVLLYNNLIALGYDIKHEHFFDTLLIDLSNNPNTSALRIKRVAVLDQINFRYFDNDEEKIGIAIDETTTISDIKCIINIFAEAADIENTKLAAYTHDHIPPTLQRQSDFLTHEVFRSHHSETQMLRYIKSLEQKDLSLAFSMIPLGSCTMKLNATTQMMPVSFANFAQIHPFVPLEQTKGYQQIFQELEQYLCQITGFTACSLQPNSGAQGEYAGLMVIRAYHYAQGNEQRKIALIPQSAHGTNPASAVMAGMDVIVV
ncbi:MAG TPA: glycine dehydrogenase (aminomethyl-transferring), partial [Chitinophagales bacterium]|nr:glycine dehydrogenase (aminomethyl-transferring) [Chitinophagales bacterium]